MQKLAIAATLALMLAGCFERHPSSDPPDAMPSPDASLVGPDATPPECSVFDRDCTAPLACLWLGDDIDGTCRTLGGIQGIGRTPEDGDCTAHAVCEPGLGCFNTSTEPPGTIVIGTCQVLCEPSTPTQCTAPLQCTSIPGTAAVGYCI